MRAVFLDKDGTLIDNVPYNVNPDLIGLVPGVVESLRSLHEGGYLLMVVTNQSGVARGQFSESAVYAIEARLRELLAEARIPLAGFYYCPHHPAGNVPEYSRQCTCRKPQPGLILRAAETHEIDLEQSWLIGDLLDDVEAGQRAGCHTILIDPHHETEWHFTRRRVPRYVARDFKDAAQTILAADYVIQEGRLSTRRVENRSWAQL